MVQRFRWIPCLFVFAVIGCGNDETAPVPESGAKFRAGTASEIRVAVDRWSAGRGKTLVQPIGLEDRVVVFFAPTEPVSAPVQAHYCEEIASRLSDHLPASQLRAVRIFQSGEIVHACE